MTKVTVIAPDQDVLDLFRELLEMFGHEAQTYTDALPGIEELTASLPDLVIVDAELDPHREQLTGLQVVHSARSGAPLRNVPIIVCTTATDRITAAMPEVMERGDIHRLEKPFDVDTFERVVETALGLGHGPADAHGHGRILAADTARHTGE